MLTQFPERKHERGVMLIEALLAILIFSIGILAVVGMQGVAIKDVAAAKYRSDAGFLVDELIATMWIDSTNLNNANYAYAGSGTPPAKLDNWITQVKARLPLATVWPPIVEVTNDPSGGAEVTIQLRWQTPSEASKNLAEPHLYTAVASVHPNN